MGYDPDPPTRRIPPQPPASAPAAQVRETEHLVEQQLLDRIRSLQTALALVGVLAAAALGVALYALLAEDDEGAGRGASRQSVSELREDVRQLDERVDARATQGDLSELQEDVTQLRQRVERASSDDAAREAREATEGLQADLDELTQRVEALEQSAGEPTSTTP